jgi:hypothetical protein
MRKWSKRIEYNGIEFNSTLEVKFALMIEDTCEYMYEPLAIWYNRTNLNLRIKEECPHRYVPDFLVRKIKDNSAHLIEVKPHYELTDDLLQVKKFITERYIREKAYDWKFHIITDKQINLSKEKQHKFEEIKKTRGFLAAKKRQLRLEKRFNPNYATYRNKFPIRTNLDLEERDYLFYLKKGSIKEDFEEI